MIDRRPHVDKESAGLWETLDERAAEAVRKHLVALRGGAPFLSPDDSSLLDTWLRDGWSGPQIIHALERAADARRKRPQRLPLTLRSARPHLGKAHRGALRTAADRPPEPAAAAHPLAPLAAALRERPADDPRHDQRDALADALLALPVDDPQLLEARAQTLCRDFLLRAWTEMEDWEREERLDDARQSLHAVREVLSAAAFESSAEEVARDQLRQAYPLLSAATIRQLLPKGSAPA